MSPVLLWNAVLLGASVNCQTLPDKGLIGLEATLILKRNCNFQTVTATHRPEYYIESHYVMFNLKFSIPAHT